MARLPSTIYRQIEQEQHRLYKAGMTNGSLPLGVAYQIFDEAGYGTAAANKWLLNWAISKLLRFEKDKDHYRIRLGDFSEYTVHDLTDNGHVWLPCKDVWIKKKRNGVGVEI